MILKKIRESAGISQVELAGKLGVSQQAVAKWESGISFPRGDLIPKIADALGCNIDQLFGREEVKPDDVH